MFQEYDVVRLKVARADVSVMPGTIGTILLVYPDTPPAYEVEFVDDAGNSLGTFTLRGDELVGS